MFSLFTFFRRVIAPLKAPQGLTLSAMLIAMNCALRLLVIPVSATINVSLFFLTAAVGAQLLGPIAAALIAAAGDLISYFVRPTGPFFPGFTLNALITGLIFGLFLFQKKPTFFRLAAAELTQTAAISFGLSPIWLHLLYTTPYPVLYAERLVKAAILCPIELLLLIAVCNAVYRVQRYYADRVAP